MSSANGSQLVTANKVVANYVELARLSCKCAQILDESGDADYRTSTTQADTTAGDVTVTFPESVANVPEGTVKIVANTGGGTATVASAAGDFSDVQIEASEFAPFSLQAGHWKALPGVTADDASAYVVGLIDGSTQWAPGAPAHYRQSAFGVFYEATAVDDEHANDAPVPYWVVQVAGLYEVIAAASVTVPGSAAPIEVLINGASAGYIVSAAFGAALIHQQVRFFGRLAVGDEIAARVNFVPLGGSFSIKKIA